MNHQTEKFETHVCASDERFKYDVYPFGKCYHVELFKDGQRIAHFRARLMRTVHAAVKNFALQARK